MKYKTKASINTAIVTAAVVICVIIANIIISAIGQKLPMRIDLTKNKIYEFSQQTKDVMSSLDDEVTAYAMYPENAKTEYVTYVKEYLAKYEALNSNFKARYIDPYNDPTFVKKYETNGQTIEAGSVIVECKDNFRVVSFNDLYVENSATGSVYIDMEKKITSAVMAVTGDVEIQKVYFSSGNAEKSGENLKKAFTDDGYEVIDIDLSVQNVPDDCNLLVFEAPKNDFTPEQRDNIDKYLLGGGQAMFMFSPGAPIPERIDSYLKDWGITVRNDFVVEGDSSRAYQSQIGGGIPAPDIAEHEITKNIIASKLDVITPVSRSIEYNENNVYYTTITPLLKTTENSWGKINLNSNTMNKEDGDINGPLTIAVLAEKSGQSTGRIFVMGSMQAVETNGILNEASYANGDFLLNTAAYMTKKADSLNIRAKVITPEALKMTQNQVLVTCIIIQYVIPIIIFLIGIVVWLRRRYL